MFAGVSVAVLIAAAALAAPGDLDRGFGSHGIARVPLAGSVGSADGVAAGPGGRLYLVGTTANPQAPIGVAVTGQGGRPERAFSEDGRVEFGFGGARADANSTALAVATDGRVTVVGDGPGTGFDAARFTAAGAFDPTFGGDGLIDADVPNAPNASAASVIALFDGKTLVGGTSGPPSERDFTVARYLADGSLDPSFSGNGSRTLDLGAAEKVAEIALAPDGAIVIGGISAGKVALARLLADGTPDNAFGGDGSLVSSLPANAVGGIAVDGAGRIAVGGTTGARAFAARFTTAGDPDASFSTDGLARINFPGYAGTGEDIVVLPTGGVAVGVAIRRSEGSWSDADFAAIALGDAGQPERAFADRGKAIVDLRCEPESLGAATLAPTGRLILAGTCGPERANDPGSFALAGLRGSGGPPDLDADGVVDRRDRCPQAFGARKTRGCPRVARDIAGLRYANGAISGRLDAADADCEYRQEVELFRERRGGNRRVAHQDTTGDRFSFKAKRGSGTYIVVSKRRREARAGFCGKASAILKP